MFVVSDQDIFGVYELADDTRNTVYYGSGKVKTRLMDHLNKKECPLAKYYRHEYLDSEQASRTREEQLLREYKATHGGKLPMYNERIG
jgi:predicted GIY-YIG superfamily endonuclease